MVSQALYPYWKIDGLRHTMTEQVISSPSRTLSAEFPRGCFAAALGEDAVRYKLSRAAKDQSLTRLDRDQSTYNSVTANVMAQLGHA